MARNTEWVYFSGKGSWFNKLYTPDMEYGNWQVKLNFNEESYQRFVKLKEPDGEVDGILNEIKQDDEGYFHVFKRPIKKEYKDKNNVTQTIFFDPPVILDGSKLDAKGSPQLWDRNVGIGNGSDITVKAEVYKYNKPFKKGKGRAIRLASVLIENAIPYERDSLSPKQEKAVEGLAEQPRQMW